MGLFIKTKDFNRLEAGITSLDERMNRLEAGITSLDERTNSLDERMNRLEAVINSISGTINYLNGTRYKKEIIDWSEWLREFTINGWKQYLSNGIDVNKYIHTSCCSWFFF